MFKLSTPDKSTILSGNNTEKVHELYYLNENEICIRQTRTLSGYKYDESTKVWTQKWTQTIFQVPGSEDEYSLKRYPWLITDQLLPDKKILILKHPDGVQLYELHNDGFKLLKEDGNFHDTYSFKYIFGNFYGEQNSMGVMTSSNLGEINFYVINEDSFNDDEDDPLFPLNIPKNQLSNDWNASTTQFYITKFQNQDVIVLKTVTGELEFYQISMKPTIKLLLKTTQIDGIQNSERLYFVNLTNQKFQDIVALSKNGLQVYQYDADNKDYKLLNHHLRFTSENGWKSSFSNSINFMDVNNDQKDDLIFTGEDGLTVNTFDVENRKWNELITPQSLSLLQRYGEIIPIINQNHAKDSTVFIKNMDGTLQWARVIPVEQKIQMNETVTPKPTIEPSLKIGTKLPVQTRKELREKPILRLAEYIDDDFIKEVIDMANGQVDFSIPLVDTLELTGIPLKLKLNYNSQVISSDLVGTGWSFPIGQDYIYVDYQGSIFLEDAVFYLVIEGQTIRLDLTSNTDVDILQFEITQEISDEEVTIQFNKSTQTWILNGETYQRVYGKANTENAKDCLRWSLSYPNWRGTGTSANGLEPIVVSWYLNTHIDKKRRHTLYYDYLVDSRIFENHLYNSEIFLEKIRSDFNFQLTLNYEKKTKDEYTISNPKNYDGKIEFPVLLTKDRYLKHYSIQTDNYQQSITFQYQLIDKKRLLTAIEQEIYTETESIFKFQYEFVLNTHVLAQLTLPRGSLMQFKYKTFHLPEISIERKNILTYRTNSANNIKFSYADDYVVMGHDNISYIHLKILNRELTEEVTSVTCPGENIQDYQVYNYKNYIVVFVTNEYDQSLVVFTYHDEKWRHDPILYKFPKNVSIQFGDTLIAVSDIENNTIQLFDTKNKVWKDPSIIKNFHFKALAVHRKYVIVYDDTFLWMFYHKSNQWHRQQLYHLPGKISEMHATINKFAVDSDVKQKYIKDLTANCFQIMKNIVIINTIRIINDQLRSEIHLITINAQHKVGNVQTYEFKREYIYDLLYKLPHEGSFFHLTYVQENGKYRLKVTALSGEIISEIEKNIRNKNLREDAINEQLEKINGYDNFKKIFDENYLINWQSLLIHAVNEFIQHGENDILQLTGTGWELKSLPEDFAIDLGQEFRIISQDKERKLFKLYKNGKLIKEFQIVTPGYMVNRFPIYLAYQSHAHTVKVLIFKDNGKILDREHSFDNEQLIMESNYQNLITKANTTLEESYVEPYECLIRPIATLISSKEQYYVQESTLSLDELQRKTAYDQTYKYNSKNAMYTQTVTLIPNGDKTYAGWHEIMYSRNIHTGLQTKSRHWYDSKGTKLESKEEQPQKREQKKLKNQKPPKNPMLLMDQSDQLVICDLSPYVLTDEMISYYGFESYEINKSWKYNTKNVVENLNAFTGQNYLQINHGSRLEGTFKPRDQHISYLASCWIRSTNLMKLNEATSILKMNLRTEQGEHIFTGFGKVKQQSNDWYYLELIIDFGVVKKVYKDYVAYYKNKKLPSLNYVKFEITLLIESDSRIDLDHIRFSPITHAFEAFVYHSKFGIPIATIHETGLVTRTVYNNMNKKIATIQEDSKIVELISTSETGRLVPAPQGIQFKNPYPSYLSFIPEKSSYETFTRGWETATPNAWHVAKPGQLSHIDQKNSHQLKAVNQMDMSSVTLRFFLASLNTNSYVTLILGNLGELKFIKNQNYTTMILPNKQKVSSLPPSGEIIIMVEENFITIWFDSVLIVDQYFEKILSEQELILKAQGEILIEDFMILNHPVLEIQYMNKLGEKTQVIKFESTQTVLVNQIIYDALGRKAITAKTSRINRQNNQSPLFIYRQNFVTNIDPNDSNSVWHTNRLHGEIHEQNPLDQGVAFIRTEYWDNPLNEEKIIGLPGPEFSTSGACATWVAKHSKLSVMDNLFPKKFGYTQNVQISSNGAERVTVYDQHRNKVAVYVHVPGFNHLLSTYEYNSNNQLIKILPPVYHEKVETALKITAYQPENLTADELKWQRLLATNIIYNENGHVIRKIAPDFGPIDYLYDANNKLRFMVISNEVANRLATNQIVFFDHNNLDQLVATGFFNQTLGIEELKTYTESILVPNTKKFQQLDYSDYHPDPNLRGRIKHCITYNDDNETILEKLRYDSDERIVERKTLSVVDDMQMKISKHYKNDKIQRLSYPKVDNQFLDIDFIYNRLGQLIELKTSKVFAKFTYHSTGELASESFQANNNNLIRKYRYNSPGFLEQINDPFMTETMSYTEKGYGQTGYGDGIIMQTQFTNNWSKLADTRWFQITEDSLKSFTNQTKLCLSALKQNGYLNNHNMPIKLYVIDSETTMPLVCGTGKIAQMISTIIAQKYVPQMYGYQYSYGNHQELIKAKYFTNEIYQYLHPLQTDSFSKFIPEISSEQSEQIWKLLTDEKYILKDQPRHHSKTAIGKRGKSFFRDKDLRSDLASLDQNYVLYLEPIKKFITNTHQLSRQSIDLNEFIDAFVKWEGANKSSMLNINWYKKIGEKIGMMLKNNGYFSISSLDNNFVQTLSQFTKFIPKIVQILSDHFMYGLGGTPFDHESYEIDANGNHQFFVSNFNKYKIDYKNYSNKINKIEISKIIHEMDHDANGNIIKAMHKGIEHIEYHPVTQRATCIRMTNGLTLRFYYDAAGERILKKVFNEKGKLQYEIRYVRDTQGHVLIDQRKNYLEQSTEEILTYYLYGPRGLIGFIRNDTYFHIITDHAGSIRLIIRAMDNEVITAFDYLPYGKLMRAFGDLSFMYRYTGHEWDAETGLYNYHARLYDPSIGRFYQPDPKFQYFSPYVYAGNSPISTIDPDGEFAFLIAFIIVGAIAGAYLGGAAANNRWNPLKWDWKDPGTYFGMFFGGLSGAFLPVTLGASVAFFGGGLLGIGITTALALTGSYIMMSVENGGNFNPKKWDWSSPKTLNGFYDGLGLITGLFTGVGSMHKFANKLGQIGSRLTKTKFLLLSYSTGIAVAYAHGVMSNEGKYAFWEWNWKNANTYAALISGFDIGSGLPQNFKEVHLGFKKWRANKITSVSSSKRQLLKAIVKNPKHPLYKIAGAVLMGYFVGASANNDFDFTQWRFDTFATYEGILNGMFLGRQASTLLSSATKTLRKSISKLNPNRIVNRILRKNMRFIIEVIANQKKNSKFFNLIETNFHKMDPKLIEKLPNALKQDIIEFFRAGYKKWKSGKTKMPKQLEEMLRKQAVKYIEGTSKELKQWQIESEDIHRQQQEVHTDRDLEFLSCRRKSVRRRKRAPGGSVVCLPSTSNMMDNEDENPQRLFNHLLEIKDSGLSAYDNPDTNNFKIIQPKSAINPDGFDPHTPKDFSENFSLILQKSPYLFDVNNKDFTSHLIAGSLYSSTSNLRGSINDIFMKTESIARGHSLVKVAFKTIVGDETILVLKSFVIEPKKSAGTKSNFNDFNNIYDQNELSIIIDKLKIPVGTKYSIKEHVFFIQHGHVLYGKDVSPASLEKYTYNTKFKRDQKVEFKEINPELNADFEKQVIKIRQTDDVTEMNTNVKAMIVDLLKMYNKYEKVFNLKPSKTSPKPGLTSFLYGAISSHLDNTFIHRIAGKGYANLIFHVPKDSWQDIPVVLERGIRKTSAFVKTMFYSLSIKSLSKRGLAVVIDTEQPAAVEIHNIDTPIPRKFIPEISTISGPPNADNIREILRYHYYNISNLALKTTGKANDHYHRSLIIGQLMSDSSINAFFYKEFNSKFSSFAISDAALKKWTQINLLENSKEVKGSKRSYKFVDEDIIAPTTLPSTDSASSLVNKIDIKLNSRSKSGWELSEKLEITNPEDKNYYYFQGLETSSSQLTSFTSNIDHYTRLETVKIGDLFVGTESMPSSAMKTLKENLKLLSSFINSESDFQAILHGMFLNNKKEATITESGYMYRVYAESNPAKSGRIDLLVQKFEIDIHNQPHEKELIVMELKYTDKNDEKKMLDAAEEQGLKYDANLLSFTNLDSFTLIPMVYDKKSGDILYKIKKNQSIRETISVSDPDSDPEPSRKRPRVDRSIHDEHINSSIYTSPTELIDTRKLIPQYAIARGARLEFWPISVAKKAGTAAISLLSTWTNFNNKPNENPTLLEMGDNWVQNTDSNGLLTWGIYLANKMTGYRPKPIPQDNFDEKANTELQIRSTMIVDRFMDSLSDLIETNIKYREIFENTVLYYEAIKKVQKKLSMDDIQSIPEMLFKLLIKNNVDKFMSDELHTKMSDSNQITEFLEFINKQEFEWLLHKQSTNSVSDFTNIFQQPQQITNQCVLPKNFPNIDTQNSLFIN